MPTRFFRTKDGDRPELAAIGGVSQLDVMGYAFPKLFPLIAVGEKAGTLGVAPANLTTSKGSKDRANSATLSATALDAVDVSWTAHRYEGRGKIFERDGAAYNSDAAADEAGTLLSQRLAWNKVEDDAFATVFTAARKSAAATLTDHQVVKILQQKAKTVRAYGKPALVMTTNTWLDFCEIPEIQARFQAFAGAGSDIGFLTTAAPKVLEAVSTLMAFDQIILFDSAIVDSGGTYDGIINVIGLRREAQTMGALSCAKQMATYGWTPVYIPEGADADKPFDMRTWYDNNTKANIYDSEAWLSPTEAMSSAVVPCKMAASYTPVAAVAVTVGS